MTTTSASNGGTVLPMVEMVDTKPAKAGIPAWAYILNWIVFSNLTILFNKWLIDSGGFKYPIILTCWHLVFATIATQILARTTSLLDSRRNLTITSRLYVRTILPIGVVYSGSLVCSNLVYLYLSVAFIQMLKAVAPVAVLLTSWAWGVADPNLSKFLNVMVIVLGVAVASFGEISFSWLGFLFQLGGTVFEAIRLVMIQVMLSGEGLNMDPLVGLYYYAPVCAALNILIACFSEVPKFKFEALSNVGFTMLILNALVAFMLNIASVSLIGKTSGLVMTLTGIFKSILLVIVSVFIWSTKITLLQCLGYTIALAGLTYYSVGYDQLITLYHSFAAWMAEIFYDSSLSLSSSSQADRKAILIRRALLAGVALLLICVLLYEFVLNNETTSKILLFSSRSRVDVE